MEMLTDVGAHAEKFDSGTMSRGSKVRKGLQDIKKKIKDVRDAVTIAKNAKLGK